MDIDNRLATYGTLAPGRSNHHQLAGLRGRWLVGSVKGRRIARGWGAALGFPALILAENGEDVEVHVFVSPDLPAHWDRLDAFEGSGYRRAQARVETTEGKVDAWIYVAADAAP